MKLFYDLINFNKSLMRVRSVTMGVWNQSYIYAAGIKILTAIQFMALIKLVSLNLSLSDAGMFFILNNVALVFSAIFFSTHSASLLRLYSAVPDMLQLYKTLFIHIFFLGLIIITAAILMNFFYTLSHLYIIALLYSVSTGVFLILITKLRAQSNFKRIFYLTLLQNIICFCLVFGSTIFFNLTLEVIFGCMVLSVISTCFFYLFHKIRSIMVIFSIESNGDTGREILSYGLPFVFVALSNTLISTSGQFMLKYLGYRDEVGIFAANYNIGEKSVFIWLSLIISVNVPKIYAAYERFGFNVAINIVKKCIYFLIFCGSLLFVFSLIWSTEISSIFTSSEISNLGHWIIPFTVVSAMLLGICSLIAEPLLILKKSKTVGLCYFLTACVSLISSYILILNYGLRGAVMAPILSNLFFLLVLVFFVKRVFVYDATV